MCKCKLPSLKIINKFRGYSRNFEEIVNHTVIKFFGIVLQNSKNHTIRTFNVHSNSAYLNNISKFCGTSRYFTETVKQEVFAKASFSG